MEQLYDCMKEFVNVYRERIRPLLKNGNIDGAAMFIGQELARESSLREAEDMKSAIDGEFELATTSGYSKEYAHYLLSLKLLRAKASSEENIGDGLRDDSMRREVIKSVDNHVEKLSKLLN